MSIIQSSLRAAVLIMVALALAVPAGAAVFSPMPGQAETPVVADKARSGAILFSPAAVSEQIDRGRTLAILSVPIEVDNRSRKDLLLKALDIWVVAGDGTVIGTPRLRQDGIAVWRAEAGARRRVQIVAEFQLGGVGPFDRFELHWGGLLAYKPRSGVVEYRAEPGQGYVPAPGAPEPAPLAEEEGAVWEDEFDTAFSDYPAYDYRAEPGTWCDYDFWCGTQATFHVGIGFGWWYPSWGWAWSPWYPWYPWYPAYPVYPIYPGHGRSPRQVKEDAVLRASGRDPASPGEFTSGVERVNVDGARSRDRRTASYTLDGRAAAGTAVSSRTGARSRAAGDRRSDMAGRRSPSRSGASAGTRSGSSRRPTTSRAPSRGSRGSSAGARGRSSYGGSRGGSMGGGRSGGAPRGGGSRGGGSRGGGSRGGGRGR